MTVRAVEWKKPYTGWKAIEITEDKVINLKLRDENNLIIWDEWDNEIYVDLQLPDEIRPTDAFPVWVNTGRVIVDNWWDVTWTILVFKTTSGDNVKFLYWDDWKLYIDNGTWSFKQIYLKWEVDLLLSELRTYINWQLALKEDKLTAWANITIQDVVDPVTWETIHEISATWGGWGWSYTAWTGINIDSNNEISVDSTVVATQTDLSSKANASDLNTKTFYLSNTSDLTNAQTALDWYLLGKNPIIVYENIAYFVKSFLDTTPWSLSFYGKNLKTWFPSWWLSYISEKSLTISFDNPTSHTVTSISASNDIIWTYLEAGANYTGSYTPQYNWNPTSKKYVDDRDTYVWTSAPTSNVGEWRLWYDTTNDVLKVHNGTSWEELWNSSVVSWDANTTYTIKVSSSAPASWTPNTTITFKTAS